MEALRCGKCGKPAHFVRCDGVIAVYRCGQCGTEAYGLLEPDPQLLEDPFVAVNAIFTDQGEASKDLMGLRHLVPALQDTPVAQLIDDMRSGKGISIGRMRVSMLNELIKHASESKLRFRFDCRPAQVQLGDNVPGDE
jgi:hypothetical protein